MVTDVYSGYYRAEAEHGGVKRNGVLVKLTADSEGGNISYEVSAAFFPHIADDDFAVSYDMYLSEVIYSAKGRRSRKKEAAFLEDLRKYIDGLSEQYGARVIWEEPLGEARRG